MKKTIAAILCLALGFSLVPATALATSTPASTANTLPIAPAGTFAVFVSPHPDDDTYSMGATIAANINAGRHVYVFLVTDGEGSNLINTYADLSYRRRNEFINAMKAYGGLDFLTNPQSLLHVVCWGERGPNPAPSSTVSTTDCFKDKYTSNGMVTASGSVHLQAKLQQAIESIEGACGQAMGLLVATVPQIMSEAPSYPSGLTVFQPAQKNGTVNNPFLTEAMANTFIGDHAIVAFAALRVGKGISSNGVARTKLCRTYLSNAHAHEVSLAGSVVYPAQNLNSAVTSKVESALDAYASIGQSSTPPLYAAVYSNSGCEYLVGSDYYTLSQGGMTSSGFDGFFRAFGATRYATSAAIAQECFAVQGQTMVVTRGDSFPDALVASGLAGAYDAPLLLCTASSISVEVQNVIAAHAPTKIYIVGGGISAAVKSTIQSKAPGASIVALEGADRYQTSTMVFEQIRLRAGSISKVFIADGQTAAGATIASSFAGRLKIPVLLVNGSAATPGTAAISAISSAYRYGIQRFYIVGGTDAVSASYTSALQSCFPNATSNIRFDGVDRYETALKLMTHSDFRTVAVASHIDVVSLKDISTTELFSTDALCAAAAAGAKGAALLFTNGSSLPSYTQSAMYGTAGYSWILINSNTAFSSGGYIFSEYSTIDTAFEERIRVWLHSRLS